MIKKDSVYGLVVCGGLSSRMGCDKSKLIYHSTQQLYHLADLLNVFCERTFISCNHQQQSEILPEYEYITDHHRYQGIGPMAALLSAFSLYTEKDLFVLACDHPFLTHDEIERFFNSLQSVEHAKCFYDTTTDYYQPLLGWYPHTAAPLLFEMFEQSNYSLQLFLKKINAGKYIPLHVDSLKSIDTPEAYLEAKLRISKK